ncbi:MAG: hypothetical protein ACI9G1_005231 [Pirellulaceae bacterium]|jgi:hypothetical protein
MPLDGHVAFHENEPPISTMSYVGAASSQLYNELLAG